MFLNKEAILKAVKNGDILISNFNEDNLKAATYTLTLSSIYGNDTAELKPKGFILLETNEHITLNGKYCGLMITPSYLAKQGLNVTQGSNFAEPDTDNIMILETSNNSDNSVFLKKGMKILKIAFTKI